MPTTVPASVTSLESLVEFLTAHRQDIRDESLDVTSLPTFGGEEPNNTLNVYSWDATRLLVDNDGAWAIVSRPAVPFASYDVVEDSGEDAGFFLVPFDGAGEPVDHPVADLWFATEQSAREAAEKAMRS